jgi:hypothetical protein
MTAKEITREGLYKEFEKEFPLTMGYREADFGDWLVKLIVDQKDELKEAREVIEKEKQATDELAKVVINLTTELKEAREMLKRIEKHNVLRIQDKWDVDVLLGKDYCGCKNSNATNRICNRCGKETPMFTKQDKEDK